MPITIRPIVGSDKRAVQELLMERWDSPLITSRGKLLDGRTLPGFIAESESRAIAGLITLNIESQHCEIVSIDSLERGLNIGTALLDAARDYAARNGCKRLWLVTTNDNLDALRFYQRRGMRLAKVYPGAIDAARKALKPEIPEVGEYGIPIRDEIELELLL